MQQSIIRRAKNYIKRKFIKRDKVKIKRTGAWDGEVNHHFDVPLADALYTFFAAEKKSDDFLLADMGSGSQALYTRKFVERGLACIAFDGNKNILTDSDGLGRHVDLTVPLELDRPFDWIMCLEVGEHIPKKFETMLIDNLDKNNKHGVVLSWALPNQKGRGHVNLQPNSYIIDLFAQRGYAYDEHQSSIFRQSSTLPWFKSTIMVFRKEA